MIPLHRFIERLRRAWHYWRGPTNEQVHAAMSALHGREYYELYEDRYRQLHNAGISDLDFIGVSRLRALVYQRWDELLRDHLVMAPGATAVELGCGEGAVILHFAAAGYRAAGIDVSQTAIAAAAVRAAAAGLEVDFRVGNVLSLDQFESGAFDIALDIGCLHMLVRTAHRRRYLREVHRVLRPGGVFFLFNRASRRDITIENEDAAIIRSITHVERRWIRSMKSWVPTRGCGFRFGSVRQYRAELEAAGFEVIRASREAHEGFATILARVPASPGSMPDIV